MKFISRTEEFMLLTVWQLKDNAYAVPIRQKLKNLTGKTWAFGAVFVMLNRLEQKELLDSYVSPPTAKRGGRSKRIYSLTAKGVKALIEVKKIQEFAWREITDLPNSGK